MTPSAFGVVHKSIPHSFAEQLAARSSKGRVVWHGSKSSHKKIKGKGLKPKAPWGKNEAERAMKYNDPYSLTRRKAVFASTSPSEAVRYAEPGSRMYAIDPDAVKIHGSFDEGDGVETVMGRVPKRAILHSQPVNGTTWKRF